MQNVIIYSLTPIIEVKSSSYSTAMEAALVCPSGTGLPYNTESQTQHIHYSSGVDA